MADRAVYPARLVSYIELIGAVTVTRSPTIMAALILVLQVAAQELIEDLRRFLEASWTDMVRFASGRKDIGYYESELADGRLNELLVEAVCRMKDIQLLIRHLGTPATTSRLFGVNGPLYEIVEVDGQWYTLRQPIVPWTEMALAAVAQEYQSHNETDEELEAVDMAGPSHARRSSRRVRKMLGSLKQKTFKKTSRSRHLQFEVISSPVPSHVRSILTSTRAAARRLSDLARRTLLARVRFNPVAVVNDISPLPDKVPERIRLPEDTVRQDDGDALELVRADEAEEREQMAAMDVQAAVEVEDQRQEENVVAEEEVTAAANQEEEEEATNDGEETEREEVVAAANEEQEVEAANGREEVEREEVVAAENEEQAVEAENGEEEIEGEEAVAGGEEEEVHTAPAAEVVELQGPAFEFDNNTYVCRLPGCPQSEKRFATLKGWKIHASNTRVHQQQGYCTGCGHYVVMPPQLQDFEKKIWLDSHRRERCAGASRAVLKARRLEKQRLEALWRDASHVRLPDDDEVNDRRGHKRAYPTDDERRAGVCLAYIKHFKSINPARLDEVAADFHLTIL